MIKVVTIHSNDKTSGTNGNFSVQLYERNLTQNVRAIGLLSVSVPNTDYNINSTNNTLIYRKVGDLVNSTFVLPVGQYSISDLITALESGVVIAGNTFVVSQEPLSFKLTFQTDVDEFEFIQSSLFTVLGMVATQTSVLRTLNSPYLPDLGGLKTVSIHSTALAPYRGIDADSGQISLLDVVSFHNTPFGNYAWKEYDPEKIIRYDSPVNLSVIDLRVRTNEGRILDIGVQELSISFKLYYQ